MTITHSVGLKVVDSQSDFAEAAAAETAEGTPGTTAGLAEALALEGTVPVPGHFTYSATAEGRTGEVAVNAIDLDGEPGLIYSGPAGGAVTVEVKDLDVSEGTIAPEATDSVVAAVFLNNTVVAFADEGYTAELDTETAVEFNTTTYVGGLQPLDVIRVGLIGGGEEVTDWDVAVGGKVLVY